MRRPYITVAGSANADVVLTIDEYPKAGETIRCHKQMIFPGGKGANQAIACARLGGRTGFIGSIGKDSMGAILKDSLTAAYIDTRGLVERETAPTGTAYILVDKHGSNTIVVSVGANDLLATGDVDACLSMIAGSSAVLTQLEIPFEIAERLVGLARNAGVPSVVNLAPPRKLSADSPLWKAGTIIVNEHESFFYTGFKPDSEASAKKAAAFFIAKGCGSVIITLGELGAFGIAADTCVHARAAKVKVVDTTAAGDTFAGAFVVEFARTGEVKASMDYAAAAAGIAVSRMGAQTSIPFEPEVRRKLSGVRSLNK